MVHIQFTISSNPTGAFTRGWFWSPLASSQPGIGVGINFLQNLNTSGSKPAVLANKAMFKFTNNMDTLINEEALAVVTIIMALVVVVSF